MSLHEHAGYKVLEDEGGLRNIVVTEKKHGNVSGGDLPSEPTVADIRRWANVHVNAGDAEGDAIKSDINAAILAAGATLPAGLKFNLAVDSPEIMHIVVPFADSSEVGFAEAEADAGGGVTAELSVAETTVVELAEVTTTEAVQEETSVETAAEIVVGAIEMEVVTTSTTAVLEVEALIVPGFLT